MWRVGRRPPTVSNGANGATHLVKTAETCQCGILGGLLPACRRLRRFLRDLGEAIERLERVVDFERDAEPRPDAFLPRWRLAQLLARTGDLARTEELLRELTSSVKNRTRVSSTKNEAQSTEPKQSAKAFLPMT